MAQRKTNDNTVQQQVANTIKVGTFQLQTKSFWIGLVAILCLFMLSVIWLNSFYWYKICNNAIESNKQLVQLLNKQVKK